MSCTSDDGLWTAAQPAAANDSTRIANAGRQVPRKGRSLTGAPPEIVTQGCTATDTGRQGVLFQIVGPCRGDKSGSTDATMRTAS